MRGSRLRSRSMRLVLAFALILGVVPAATAGGATVPAKTAAAPAKTPAGFPVDAAGHPYVEGEVLVKFAAGISTASVGDAHEAIGATVIASSEGVPGLQKARLPKGISAEAAAKRYRDLPGVVYAQPNYLHAVAADAR